MSRLACFCPGPNFHCVSALWFITLDSWSVGVALWLSSQSLKKRWDTASPGKHSYCATPKSCQMQEWDPGSWLPQRWDQNFRLSHNVIRVHPQHFGGRGMEMHRLHLACIQYWQNTTPRVSDKARSPDHGTIDVWGWGGGGYMCSSVYLEVKGQICGAHSLLSPFREFQRTLLIRIASAGPVVVTVNKTQHFLLWKLPTK